MWERFDLTFYGVCSRVQGAGFRVQGSGSSLCAIGLWFRHPVAPLPSYDFGVKRICPLSSESGTCKTVQAMLGPGLHVKLLETF